MKKVFLCFLFVFIRHCSFAQTGIGTTTPHASAKLDVTATNKGFLPPRVTLTSSSDASTIPSPATGLLVYNTGANAGLRTGYYYWNGTDWTTIATPTSAETVDYVAVQASSDLTITAGISVKFNTIVSGNIPYDTSTGLFTLTAGKTYRLTGIVSLGTQASGTGSAAEANIVWRTGTAASGTNIGNYGQILSGNSAYNSNGQGLADIIYTPTTNTTISLYVSSISSTVAFRGGYTNAIIEQIGSNSIINPWVLSGNDVYNTTGKVGIGTNTPTTTLDVTGSMTVSSGTNLKGSVNIGTGSGTEGGEIDLANAASGTTLTGSNVAIDVYGDKVRIFENGGTNRGVNIDLSKAPAGVSGELLWKASGLVDAGSFITLDNLKATVTTSGARGLSISTVSGTMNVFVQGTYTNGTGSISSDRTSTTVAYNTTPSGSTFGWSFGTAGDTVICHILDPTNSKMYRITLMIQASYIKNFISIERLL